jgi:Leucine-rich repeat (LRR) protein
MGIFLGDKPVSVYFNGTNASVPVQGVFLGPIQVFPTGTAADPFATLVSTKSTGNVAGNANSTTGYIKVEWWDSTSNVYGTGVAGNNIAWSKAAGGAGEKTLRIYPSDASGNLDGALTILNCSNNSLTSLDVSGLTALTYLDCSNNSLTSLDVSGLTALTYLECNNNSLTSLDVSGLTALTYLECSNNSLTSLDVSGLTSLTFLYCNNNSLTSLRAVGFVGIAVYTSPFTPSTSGYDATAIGNNNLSASALNQFYADLADITPSYALLFVGQNPGIESHDPSIATAKGWVVVNLPPPL